MVELAIGERLDGKALRPPVGRRGEQVVERGGAGGLRGGKARAEALSARKRKQIAEKAARAGWKS
jgi:hypothetical protein